MVRIVVVVDVVFQVLLAGIARILTQRCRHLLCITNRNYHVEGFLHRHIAALRRHYGGFISRIGIRIQDFSIVRVVGEDANFPCDQL